MLQPAEFIWQNGKLVPWREATVHVLAHALHYGSSVFEGVRAYRTERGTRIFRLTPHMRRLFDSAKIYRIPMPFTPQQLSEACRELITANRLEACYLRPIAFRGYGGVGMLPEPEVQTEVAIAALTWGGHLGIVARERGVEVCVSSWQRVAPNTIPATAKCAANYASSTLIVMEAKRDGYDAAIALDWSGMVSEGAGENVFLIRDGVIRTPPISASILAGITRDTVLTLARDLGYDVREEPIPREALYLADEAFYTGTAAEITPVRTIDRVQLGDGTVGPVTRALQQRFFGLFTGETPDRHGWLE